MSDAESKPNRSPRHRARELALQGIYQWRVTANEITQIEKQILDEKNLGRYDKGLFSKLLCGALNPPPRLLLSSESQQTGKFQLTTFWDKSYLSDVE